MVTKTKEAMLKVPHAEVGTTPIICNIPKEEGRDLILFLMEKICRTRKIPKLKIWKSYKSLFKKKQSPQSSPVLLDKSWSL